MFEIRKEYTIEYAHQLKDTYSEACNQTIHGHSGTIELFFEAKELDKTGMVVDFGEVSALVEEEIMIFDHALIMPKTFEHEYIQCLSDYNRKLICTPFNPTAENLAKFIFCKLNAILTPLYRNREFILSKVRFHETETGYAEYIA